MGMKKAVFAVLASLVAVSATAAPAFNKLESAIANTYVYNEVANFFNGEESLFDEPIEQRFGTKGVVYTREYVVEYTRNQIRAAKKFKGKRIFFAECNVAAIGVDARNNPYVRCHAFGLPSKPVFYFDKDAAESLADYNQNDVLNFVCEGGDYVSGVATAKHCEVANPVIEQVRESIRSFLYSDPVIIYGIVRMSQGMNKSEKLNCLKGPRACAEVTKNYDELMGRMEGKGYQECLNRMAELGVNIEEFKKMLQN